MMSYVIDVDKKTAITFITLSNGQLSATFLNFGARWHSFLTPDKKGRQENILLSLDTPESILADTAQFGALIGPVAGRIKHGQWKELSLEKNEGEHHIHGGSNGWANQFWQYNILEGNNSIILSFTLTDTTSGYPGPIQIVTRYELTQEAVIMTTEVTADTETIINPTNHAYFNLSGDAKKTIGEHSLMINSSKRLETDSQHIPTGNILPTKNTDYDFQELKQLKISLSKLPNGLNDAYLLTKNEPQIILSEPNSCRKLSISTNREAVIVFSTTGFNADFKVNQKKMTSELGIALETQELPDIINHPEWGSIKLETNSTKQYQTIYKVGLI